jgi:hypothetical protein
MVKDVTIKKQFKISVRFNNKDTDGTSKWILLIEGVPFYVSEIKLKIDLFTESYEIEDVGLKHHLSGLATKVKFKKNIAYVS